MITKDKLHFQITLPRWEAIRDIALQSGGRAIYLPRNYSIGVELYRGEAFNITDCGLQLTCIPGVKVNLSKSQRVFN